MQNLWMKDYQRLLERINKDIVSGPTLAILDQSCRFYINTGLYKDGMGAVVLKADDSVEIINSEAQEKVGGKCEF